jgi:hypothetical protein
MGRNRHGAAPGNRTLARRWYSVWSPAQLEAIGGSVVETNTKYGLWPGVAHEGSEPLFEHGEQYTSVEYCFRDDDAATRLLKLVAYGIAMWIPAAQYSSVLITPDFGCRDSETDEPLYRCVCGRQPNGEDTGHNTLIIGWGKASISEDLVEDGFTTNIGYDSRVKDERNNPPHGIAFEADQIPSDDIIED